MLADFHNWRSVVGVLGIDEKDTFAVSNQSATLFISLGLISAKGVATSVQAQTSKIYYCLLLE